MSKFVRYLLISIWIFCLIIYTIERISRDERKQILVTIVDYRWNPIVNLSIRFHHQQIQYEFAKNFNRTDLIDPIMTNLNERNLFDDLFFEQDVTVRINTINRQTNETYDDDNTIDDDDDISS